MDIFEIPGIFDALIEFADERTASTEVDISSRKIRKEYCGRVYFTYRSIRFKVLRQRSDNFGIDNSNVPKPETIQQLTRLTVRATNLNLICKSWKSRSSGNRWRGARADVVRW